jgi:hypothetical protein
MKRMFKIHGIPVTFSRSILGWTAVLGPFYSIHVKKVGNTWFAYRHMGKEYIGKGLTATAAILQAKEHYDALQTERRARIEAALEMLATTVVRP